MKMLITYTFPNNYAKSFNLESRPRLIGQDFHGVKWSLAV